MTFHFSLLTDPYRPLEPMWWECQNEKSDASHRLSLLQTAPLEKLTFIHSALVSTSFGDSVAEVCSNFSRPDKTVPKSLLAVFRILHQVRNSKTPIVVHCSAGIGRTGSFVSYRISLHFISVFLLPSMREGGFPYGAKAAAQSHQLD